MMITKKSFPPLFETERRGRGGGGGEEREEEGGEGGGGEGGGGRGGGGGGGGRRRRRGGWGLCTDSESGTEIPHSPLHLEDFGGGLEVKLSLTNLWGRGEMK